MGSFMWEKDEEKKKELQDKFMSETLPSTLKVFDDKIGKSNTGFVAASGFTWVDLFIMNTLERLGNDRDKALESYKHLKAHYEKVRQIPRIMEWLNKRPRTAQ